MNKFRKSIEFRIFLYGFAGDNKIHVILNNFIKENKIKGKFTVFDFSTVKATHPNFSEAKTIQKSEDTSTHIIIYCNNKRYRDSFANLMSKDGRFATECKIDCVLLDFITLN